MDVYSKPSSVDTDILKNLGPLAPLAGRWEGSQGVDIAPTRNGQVETKFRERLTLEPMGPVLNGPQVLYGLRYATTAWPLHEENPFHEEVGYWLWDPKDGRVMRCFIVPRGIVVNAGGKADAQAKIFEMTAEIGSVTFGVMSNPFLDRVFKTVRYHLRIIIHDDGRFSYVEDTQLQILGREGIFHHTDQNTLARM